MVIFTRSPSPLDSAKAAFRTHLNYIKCLEKLFASSTLSVSRTGTFTKRNVEITRFQKLYKVTLKSIKKDIELAREDSAFAVIAAPWFPVKCYYALYYLESVLTHLLMRISFGKHVKEFRVICGEFCRQFRKNVLCVGKLRLNIFPNLAAKFSHN